MTFTEDQISAIIGSKELEIISLRLRCNELAAENKALKYKHEPQPEAKAELKDVP